MSQSGSTNGTPSPSTSPARHFDLAAKWISENVKADRIKLTNEHKLKLYALYKQATTGDCVTSRPGTPIC